MDDATTPSARQTRGAFMEEMRKEISAIRETLAGLTPVINETNRQTQQNTQLGVQNTAQISNIANNIDGIKTELSTIRAWKDEITNWRNDLPNVYVPRREHDARAIDARVSSLEEFRVNATAQYGELKSTLLTKVQEVAMDITTKVLEDQAASQKQRADFAMDAAKERATWKRWIQDNRMAAIALAVGIVFSTVSVILTILSNTAWHH